MTRVWAAIAAATIAVAGCAADPPPPVAVDPPAGAPFDWNAYVDAITAPPPATPSPTSWTDLMLPPPPEGAR